MESALEMARAACARRADQPLLQSLETALTGREVAAATDALACALAARGIERGDRVAVNMQNVLAWPLAAIATWKLGAILVPINPMLREREVAVIVGDSGAKTMIADPSEVDLDATGPRPPDVHVEPDDVACLVYTSGTTGPPKGAMILHHNLTFTSRVWRDWPGLTDRDVNLALAPLFHITGLVAGLGTSLAGAIPLVLGGRFDAQATVTLFERFRPTFTVAAITAYQALMRTDGDFSSLRAAYSGGAPIAPAVADAWYERTGVRIHNAYGLTETTSPLTLVPLGAQTPVDPTSGALSVGVPVYDTKLEILAEDGEIGEIVASGPQVVPGYWNKPEETAHAIPDGRLRTGDVGFVDADGWVYLVDRRKDMIIASGYKVWPREVEDVLYTHPAVVEAAVVGAPDEYRGETVKAFVVTREPLEPDALIAYCRERMAAYKYPRVIEFLDELPKSATGKILRRELR
jgi:long-chain acyl-CoA synthetase